MPAETKLKSVRIQEPGLSPVTQAQEDLGFGLCSTPKPLSEPQPPSTDCISRIASMVRDKSPNGVYGAGQPRVCTVTQTLGEADSLSESSDDSGDRGSRHGGKSRSRKFHMPKLSFDGDHWNGFLSQFQLVAKNLKWSERKKLREFPLALKKEAAEFYGLLPSRKETDLEWLIKKFRDHYGSCESEQALRLEWQQSEQREDESLETYHCRFQKLVVRSMPNELEREACQKFVMDAFLRGCKDRDAVLSASGKEPKSLEDAFKWVQEASQLRKMVLGRRDGSKKVRRVEPDSEESSDGSSSDSSDRVVKKAFQALGFERRQENAEKRSRRPSRAAAVEKVVSGLKKAVREGRNSANLGKPPYYDVRCYECGEFGHFARECPNRYYFGPPRGNVQGMWGPRYDSRQRPPEAGWGGMNNSQQGGNPFYGPGEPRRNGDFGWGNSGRPNRSDRDPAWRSPSPKSRGQDKQYVNPPPQQYVNPPPQQYVSLPPQQYVNPPSQQYGNPSQQFVNTSQQFGNPPPATRANEGKDSSSQKTPSGNRNVTFADNQPLN